MTGNDPERRQSDHAERGRGFSQATVVTIDGPAGVGKTTCARLLSRTIGFCLLDSGALYRALALFLIRNEVQPGRGHVPERILQSLNLRMELDVGSMRLYLGDEDVTQSIRQEMLGSVASQFSVQPEVRRSLLHLQRSASSRWNLVAEGRDMGTVVFPDATVKFFLVADLEERARRRYLELVTNGELTQLSHVRKEIHSRDERDRSRKEAPLVMAEDAIMVDTTLTSPEEVVACLVEHMDKKMTLVCDQTIQNRHSLKPD